MPSDRKTRLKQVERLMAAMDECARARGEAQWTNGYRTGKHKSPSPDAVAEDNRLYEKERIQWERSGTVEHRFRRLALRILREASNG